jgi:hypothetical protein
LAQQTDALTIAGGELASQVSYRSMYDSNLLKYSTSDRNHFLNDTEFFRSNLRTLDDFRSDIKISTSFSLKAWGKRETQFSAVFDFAHHLMNPVKNFGWMSLTASQELSAVGSTSLNYFFDSDYYIREYYDVHTGTHQSCEFSMDQWTGRINFRPVRKFEFVGFLQYKKYANNEYFTEYDSDYFEFGGEIIYRIDPWRLAAGYHLGINENVGYNKYYKTDAAADAIEDSEEGQSDYQQDIYSLSVRYPFRLLGKRSRLLLDASLDDRYYTTDLDAIADPIHSGRNDRNLTIELSLRTDLSKVMSVEVGAGYDNRRSKASSPVVSRVKDFDRMTCWLELSHELGL